MKEVKVLVEMISDDAQYLYVITRDDARMNDKVMIEIVKSIFDRISILSNSAKASLENK